MADVERGIPTPRPWGYFATAGWLVLATLISTILFVGVVWLDPGDPFNVALSGTILIGALLAVLALAARLRHWRVTDYFGLVLPSNREIAIALAFLVVVLATEETVLYLTDWHTENNINHYNRARADGILSLLWFLIGVVVIHPIAEEMIFRGFLYRGWVKTPRSVVPGIVIISALFAVIHMQYDVFLICIVFCKGVFYGWARWWSGSTLLACLMHVVSNLSATIEVVMFG
jgi:membrane protease YdiL (CAAX protease family)